MTITEMVKDCMEANNESMLDFVASTLPPYKMDEEFENAYGGTPCCYLFTVWTKNRVYFPVCYDGMISVNSLPRNPEESTDDNRKMIGRW